MSRTSRIRNALSISLEDENIRLTQIGVKKQRSLVPGLGHGNFRYCSNIVLGKRVVESCIQLGRREDILKDLKLEID
jgi:hypothetical protein